MKHDPRLTGTTNYMNKGCRCGSCVAIKAQSQRAYYRTHVGTLAYQHGTVKGYNWGQCRCPACRKAKADYDREYRARKAA